MCAGRAIKSLSRAPWIGTSLLLAWLGTAVRGTKIPAPNVLNAFREDLKATFTMIGGGAGTSAGGAFSCGSLSNAAQRAAAMDDLSLVYAGPTKMRTLVQLGFHDCASALCDGCIDLNVTNNNGLAPILEALTPICKSHNFGIADCIAAAASMAVEETSVAGGVQARIPLFFGRIDNANCNGFTEQNPEAVFPNGAEGVTSNQLPFVTSFYDVLS